MTSQLVAEMDAAERQDENQDQDELLVNNESG